MDEEHKNTSPSYENDHVAIYVTSEGISISRKPLRLLKLIVWLGLCLAGLGILTVIVRDTLWLEKQQSISAEDFRLAVNKAMTAAELTQVASSTTEWDTVAHWWEDAIILMKSVPSSSDHFDLAQTKVQEYHSNLKYARSRAENSLASNLRVKNLWSIGSGRGIVLKLQGQPSRALQYDSFCREVLYFNRSRVELREGKVVAYENIDNNLIVLEEDKSIEVKQHQEDFWTLGSQAQDVMRLQGTPTEFIQYESIHKTLLFYHNSFIELENDLVVGYNNLDKNLRVAMTPSANMGDKGFWTLDSSSEDILAVQGTPDSVSRSGFPCRQSFHYGASIVELKNGRIIGYQNTDGNLKVR